MFLKKRSGQIITLLILAFIWGSSFILMKRGLEVFSHTQVAAFRMFIAYLVLLPMAFSRLKGLTKNEWLAIAVVGFIGNAFPAYFFAIAQTHISSSMAGILNSLTPLFTLVIGILFYKSKINILNIIGLLIGLAGAVILVVDDFSDVFTGLNAYALIIVLATLFYGININHVKTKLSRIDGVTIAILAFFIVGPFNGIVLLFSDWAPVSVSRNFWIGFASVSVLAILGSAFAVVVINRLIKETTAVFASSVTYIIPVFAMLWGLLDGEKIALRQGLAIAFVLTGVYLVNINKKNVHVEKAN